MQPGQPDHGAPAGQPPADWYPDPSRPGRLRYWDGTAWSAWVSTSGDTTLDPDPVPAAPPPAVAGGAAPPPGEPAPEAAAARPPGGPEAVAPPAAASTPPRPSLGLALASPLGIGLLVAALGAILIAASGGQTAASQGFFEIRIEGQLWGVIVLAVAIAVAAVLPQLWARLAGIFLAGATAAVGSILVIAVRLSDDFVSGRSITIEAGGWFLILGSLLAFAGLAIALLGVARRPPEPTGGSGYSTAAIILGCASIIFPLLSTLGVATGLIGMSAGRAAGTRRGLAVGGFVVALVILVAYSVPAIIAMLVAQP